LLVVGSDRTVELPSWSSAFLEDLPRDFGSNFADLSCAQKHEDFLSPVYKMLAVGDVSELKPQSWSKIGRALSQGFVPCMLEKNAAVFQRVMPGAPTQIVNDFAEIESLAQDEIRLHRLSHQCRRFSRERLSTRATLTRLAVHAGMPPLVSPWPLVSV